MFTGESTRFSGTCPNKQQGSLCISEVIKYIFVTIHMYCVSYLKAICIMHIGWIFGCCRRQIISCPMIGQMQFSFVYHLQLWLRSSCFFPLTINNEGQSNLLPGSVKVEPNLTFRKLWAAFYGRWDVLCLFCNHTNVTSYLQFSTECALNCKCAAEVA